MKINELLKFITLAVVFCFCFFRKFDKFLILCELFYFIMYTLVIKCLGVVVVVYIVNKEVVQYLPCFKGNWT